jgi:hypothetical protein
MSESKPSSRRKFMKTAAAGAAGIVLASKVDPVFSAPAAAPAYGAGNTWPGRIVINFNKNAVNTSLAANQAVITTMVDDAIKLLTGETSVGAAWKAIFPASLTATSKIAIKTCTLNPGIAAPHPFSVMAITQGLQQMDFGGAKFPASGISIYDMNNGVPSANNLGQAGYTAARFPGIAIVTDTPVAGGDGALNHRPYASTLKNADFLISVFSPRGHTIPPAGSKFTLGFKSHYGTYSSPTDLHTNVPSNMREMICTGVVYNKTVLNVLSGMYGMDEGNGPTGDADDYTTYSQKIDPAAASMCPTTLMLSTDPISIEMQSIKLMRMNQVPEGAYTTIAMPSYLKSSAGITVPDLTSTYNVGIIDEAQMDIRRIINGVSAVHNPLSNHAVGRSRLAVSQIKGTNNTFIEFTVPEEHFGAEARIEIHDARGALVRTLSRTVHGAVNSLPWNETDAQGAIVGRGMYVAHLVSGNVQVSAPFTIVR